MKKPLVALAAVAALVTTAGAGQAQQMVYEPPPPPSNGVGLLVTGGIFTGVGAVNLLTAPICKTDLFSADTQTLCLGLSLGIGIPFVVVGIPLLVVGASRRGAYLEWKRSHGAATRLLDLDFKPVPGGGALTWHASF
jgi:hypothetical protein